MNKEALACPFCRTWFEGSGHHVKCPSCGRHFDSSRARLNPGSARPEETFAAPSPLEDTRDDYSVDHPADHPIEHQTEHAIDHPAAEPWRADTPVDGTSAPPDLRLLFSILFIALILIGPRFLDGTALLVVLVSAFIARWLYGRWRASRTGGLVKP